MLTKGSSLEGKWHESAEMIILFLMLQTTVKQEKLLKKNPDLMFSIVEPIQKHLQNFRRDLPKISEANTDKSSSTPIF